jgi:hypothetical protein
MSDHTEDQRAMRELKRIAHLYTVRGEHKKAEDVLALVRDIERRLRREQRNANERTGYLL